jgi:hypothetical protein
MCFLPQTGVLRGTVLVSFGSATDEGSIGRRQAHCLEPLWYGTLAHWGEILLFCSYLSLIQGQKWIDGSVEKYDHIIDVVT